MSRAALVTGSAGGIGTSICERLRSDGFTVVGLDLHPSPSADVSIQVNVGDPAALAAVASELCAAHDVQALVHNAAVQHLGGAGEVPIEQWLDAFRVNVLAVEVLLAAARSRLAAAKGAVVCVSSVHARTTTRGIASYAATKAALEGWVRAAALDLAPDIRVNAVVPGAVDTAKLREGFARWGEEDSAHRRQVLLDRTPLRALGRADDIAAATSFLTGPASSFITGTSLCVDGGVSAALSSE